MPKTTPPNTFGTPPLREGNWLHLQSVIHIFKAGLWGSKVEFIIL